MTWLRAVPALLVLPGLAWAQGIPDACLKLAWSPTNQEVCSAKYAILRDEKATHDPALDDRKLCATGPDGETIIEYVQRAGEYVSLMSQHFPVPGVASDAARIQVDVMIPSDYDFWSGGRFPIGLLIAPEGKKKVGCHSGGCPPEKQKGSSVRIQYSGNFNGAPDTPEPQIYSYHLNRHGRDQYDFDSNWEDVKRKEKVRFGASKPLGAALPKGRWATLVLDVVLNTFDARGRPVADGWADLAMYDTANGELLGETRLTNAVYRNDPSWKIVGRFLNDKTTQHKAPPKTQSMYFSNYQMFLLDESGQGCGNLATATRDNRAAKPAPRGG